MLRTLHGIQVEVVKLVQKLMLLSKIHSQNADSHGIGHNENQEQHDRIVVEDIPSKQAEKGDQIRA